VATGAPVGANGLRESMNTGHDFLNTSMRQQMRSGEAVAVNTPADRCSPVSLDVIKWTRETARPISQRHWACQRCYN
jgi:hypothetical protein